MKKLEFEKLKQATISELQKLLQERREKLERLRFDLAVGKVKNISEIRKTRKDIARILTLINEKSRLNKKEV
jgi:large subunit ribosomal protein L29